MIHGHNDFAARLIATEPDLHRHAMFLAHGNRMNAEDLVQDVMLIALKYQDRYKDYNLKAWLFAIMNNVHINNVRMAAKESLCDVQPDKVTYTGIDETETLIKALPEHLKETFRMLVQGYEYKDIAEALNTPIGTIKYRIHRARHILQNIYTKS